MERSNTVNKKNSKIFYSHQKTEISKFLIFYISWTNLVQSNKKILKTIVVTQEKKSLKIVIFLS